MKISFFIIFILFFSSTGSNAQPNSPHFYFCEIYSDGIEIGVSSSFTTGCITAILDYRPINKIIGLHRVFLKITKVADKDGFYPDEIDIDRIQFEVQPDWDYIYFESSEKLSFKEPGIYRIYCLDDNGHSIADAFLKIIPK